MKTHKEAREMHSLPKWVTVFINIALRIQGSKKLYSKHTILASDPDWNFPSSPDVPFVHTTFFILCLKQRRWIINASISFFKSLFSSGLP